ncbi:MAG TPA: hypothetical protein VFF11_16245, partial [Candidatus Binatia bacterium]|nr:hypothetical protein [Candidatus Binatia bacterium]
MNRRSPSGRTFSKGRCRSPDGSARHRPTFTALPAPPDQTLRQRKYRALIRKNLGKLLDEFFGEFTGLHFHIAWAPLPSHGWKTQTLPTGCSVCCRLSGSPLLPDCRACGPRQLTHTLNADGNGHHLTCRLGVRNYWFPIRLRGELLGLAYLQALDHSPPLPPARKRAARGRNPFPDWEDARVMGRLKFNRAARFLRHIVQHLQTSTLAELQKEELDNVRRVLRVFENVQKRLRKKLNGLLPVFR